MKGFLVGVQLGSSMRLTADGGISFTVHTQELPSEQKLLVAEHQGAFGYMMFKQNEIELKEAEMPVDDFGDVQKPIHRRIRNACYYLAKKRLQREPTNDEVSKLYHAYMDKLLEDIKEKLDN